MRLISSVLLLLVGCRTSPGDTEIDDSDTSVDTEDTDDPCVTGPCDCDVVDALPSLLTDSSGLGVRQGSIAFEARDGNELTAFTYKATTFDGNGPILFVMHGSGRTAESYLAALEPVAEQHGALAIAPEFPKSSYPNSSDYTLGLGTPYQPSGGTYDPADWRESDDYLYSEIEHLFEAVKAELGSEACGYSMFGHSAGGQFVHRLVTFRSDARVHRAVAANSGWYTLPDPGSGTDENYYMPYGLQGTPVTEPSVVASFDRHLIVLVGEQDIATPDTDSSLRGTSEAMFQGSTRLERGQSYYALAQSRATVLDAPFAWALDTVPGAGHDKDEMAASAGWYLFRDEAQAPCEPSTAAEASGLVINEIHADPADDSSGDANGDGVRDSADDEFIELVNAGSSPLCLAGWTMGDASGPELHRFPLGESAAPGQAVVIFGGGIPTGNFGTADVQWAAFGGSLSLTNAGDVITVYDAAETAVLQVSWGTCAGETCAAEHVAGSFGINESMTRSPELTGTFVEHSAAEAGALYSPGTRADGGHF